MSNLVPIFVVGIVFLGIYRLFELFVRRKERMTIIEKFGEQAANVDFNLPLFQETKSNWALRISLLLIGLGIGLIVAYCVELATLGVNWLEYATDRSFQKKMEVVYFASVAIFGGIGLLSAYFIEQKHKK